MGQFKHTIRKSYSTDAGTISAVTAIKSADTEVGIQTVVDKAATNFHRVLAVDKTQIISMAIAASKACTVKTNSTSGDDVFDLVAGGAVLWNSDDDATCPITADITGFYFDGNGADDAAVTISFLLDQPGAGS